METLMYTVRAR